MRMASACAVTIAGMPTPATSAVPAALLSNVRRDKFEFMTIPPAEPACAMRDETRPTLPRPFPAINVRPAYSVCPADSKRQGDGYSVAGLGSFRRAGGQRLRRVRCAGDWLSARFGH